MKNATEYAKQLKKLMTHLRKVVEVPAEYDAMPAVDQMIHAFLTWETTRRQGDIAFNRILKGVIDFNDLRVTDPQQIVEMMGDRFSRAAERAYRLRLALQDIYLREHRVDLSHLASMAKRDARAYLDGLNGMVPFVSAAVLLLSLDGHAVPLDEQLYQRLQKDGIVHPDATFEEVLAFLEHQIRAEEGIEAYHLLRAYAEQAPETDMQAASSRRSTGRKPAEVARKTTTKKKAAAGRKSAK